MRKRNIYKDIVVSAVICILASALAGWGRDYAKEKKAYGFYIQAEGELTEHIVEEFRRLTGVCCFEPVNTVNVTIRLGLYTMEAEVMGLDLEKDTLKWDRALPRAVMGNTPSLFFGKEAFSSFMDERGNSPLKSQVEKWIEEYDTLELWTVDENGQKRKAKICGILQKPEAEICMEQKQMKEIFGRKAHTYGGFLEVNGYRNGTKAREMLEGAGFRTLEVVR